MSYDLFFLVQANAERISRERFQAYFEGRPHYADGAAYGNEDTGGHFWFEFDEDDEDDLDPDDDTDAPDDDLGPAGITFGLNYNRPFWFAEEAEPQVRAFIEAMGLLVEDPQVDGMGRGPYDPEGFVRGWTRGNEFALGALQARREQPPHLLPGDEVRRIHAWNLRRDAVQEERPDVFVPRISFLLTDGALTSYASFGWDVRTCLPRVDAVILSKHTRGLLGGQKTTHALVPLEAVPLGRDFLDGPDTTFVPPDISDPRIHDLFASARPWASPPSFVPAYEVFEREAYEASIATAGEGH